MDANSDNGQFVLWPLYSFQYLPVELISRIYEEFIDQRKDAVFTPIHLANLMVDECMPIAEPRSDYKIIDVSCGSGVFLVAVFKRLVLWWQKERFDATGVIEEPTVEDLKAILRNSVYGVDIEKASVRLSVFSLSIALCDMLSPTEIWTELQFDDLREKNIYEGDFFQYLSENGATGKFDLVIGNPPFDDKKKDFAELIAKHNVQVDYHIPRNEIAMLFLQQAMKLLKPNGLLSFVMPSGSLLYNSTLDFRKEFFSRHEVPQVIDLSELRNEGDLFEKTVATAVVFALNKKPEHNHNTLHITIKRSKATKGKITFELDQYDMHNVPLEVATNDPYIWKANLIGGNQLYFLIKRLKGVRTLGNFLEVKKQKEGWVYGEGFIFGNKSKKAEHLTEKLFVENSDFNEAGILRSTIQKAVYFERTRDKQKEIFKAPHLLFKEVLGKEKFVLQFVDYDLIFKNQIVGIHSPKTQEKELKSIEEILQRNYEVLKLLILSTSGRTGISRSGGYVMSKKDIMNLPYPENELELKLSQSEQIIKDDVLNFKLEELRQGEKAKINTRNANAEEFSAFARVLCDSLNTMYERNDKSFSPLEPIESESYICYPFAYGNADFKPVISPKIKEGDLSPLIENQNESVLYRRVLRLYQKDVVYLVKPKTLRYWLKSIALRDASDIMMDFVNSGY